jgi:hypothetical protein
MATFQEFIDAAWSDHADRPQEVADRLAEAIDRVVAPDHVAPFVRLAAHVHGEHLGEWQHGIDLLRRVATLPACTVDGKTEVDRAVAMLRYARGEHAALDGLAADARIAVLAGAAAALAGRADIDAAVAAYDTALQDADATGLVDGSAAIRALAVAGNNLAATLEEQVARDDRQTAAMVRAARGGLRYWQRAGTWLEHERAEYRLARSLLLAGDPRAAAESAQRCIDLCSRNGAPAFEQFFGYAALALASRAAGEAEAFTVARDRARTLFDDIAVEERGWCESELRALGP